MDQIDHFPLHVAVLEVAVRLQGHMKKDGVRDWVRDGDGLTLTLTLALTIALTLTPNL